MTDQQRPAAWAWILAGAFVAGCLAHGLAVRPVGPPPLECRGCGGVRAEVEGVKEEVAGVYRYLSELIQLCEDERGRGDFARGLERAASDPEGRP
jgi:hypothetical protein